MKGITKRIGRLLLHHPTAEQNLLAQQENAMEQSRQMIRHMMEGRQ